MSPSPLPPPSHPPLRFQVTQALSDSVSAMSGDSARIPNWVAVAMLVGLGLCAALLLVITVRRRQLQAKMKEQIKVLGVDEFLKRVGLAELPSLALPGPPPMNYHEKSSQLSSTADLDSWADSGVHTPEDTHDVAAEYSESESSQPERSETEGNSPQNSNVMDTAVYDVDIDVLHEERSDSRLRGPFPTALPKGLSDLQSTRRPQPARGPFPTALPKGLSDLQSTRRPQPARGPFPTALPKGLSDLQSTRSPQPARLPQSFVGQRQEDSTDGSLACSLPKGWPPTYDAERKRRVLDINGQLTAHHGDSGSRSSTSSGQDSKSSSRSSSFSASAPAPSSEPRGQQVAMQWMQQIEDEFHERDARSSVSSEEGAAVERMQEAVEGEAAIREAEEAEGTSNGDEELTL